jgi:hypothetical protein
MREGASADAANPRREIAASVEDQESQAALLPLVSEEKILLVSQPLLP